MAGGKFIMKILKFMAPFIFLLCFLVILGGVYYTVEQHCSNTFYCTNDDVSVNVSLVQHGQCSPLPPNEIEKIKTNFTQMGSTSYWQSIHFIVITVTTIGYGDIVPCTWQGQLVSILISIIGIPICLMALVRLGDIFGILLHKLWANAYRRVVKPPYKENSICLLSDKHYVPFYLAIIVTVFWILVCTTYFYLTLYDAYKDTRNFTFFTSFYFTMVTFMTIGSGEFAPIVYNLIFPNLIFILIGLSLLALCINIIQRKIEYLFNSFTDKIDGIRNHSASYDTETNGRRKNGKPLSQFKSHQPIAVLTNIRKPKSAKRKESVLLMLDEECQVDLDSNNCYKNWAVRKSDEQGQKVAGSVKQRY